MALGLATLALFAGLSSSRAPAEGGRRGPGPDRAADVKVLNGGARGEVCKSVAAKLGVELRGDVESYRDADGKIDYSLRETTILCDEKYRLQAEGLRDKLGFGAVVPGAAVESIEVIVGWDAAEMSFAEAPENGVFVDKSEKAVYFIEDGELTHIWPCATGKRETPTPAGRFEVTATLEKPTWYWEGKAIPPGPDNGLGDWFIGINKKRYGIHGTNEPPSIRKAVTHGCVRMYNDDAGELVKLVSPGTPVVIVE